MEDNDRKKILDNIKDLVKYTKYDILVKKCLENKLLFPQMIEEIEKSPNSQWHRLLIQKVTNRGPTGFNEFIKILEESEYPEAVRILVNITPPTLEGCIQSTQPGPRKEPTIKDLRFFDNSSKLTEYTNVIKTPEFLKDIKRSSKIIDTHHLLDTYSMKSKNRGVLFLVNNIIFSTDSERKGADKDRVNLVTLFRAFGFIIYYYENLRTDTFNDLVKILVNSEVLKTADCLVFGILTHGDEQNYAVFSDGGRMDVEDILHKFNNRDCPSLKDKPKIFLFPFCRGISSDLGVNYKLNYRKAERDSKERLTVAKMSDMLICYGSVPGFATLRDVDDGSWYIQDFCAVLAENADKMEIEELLKMLHFTVSFRRSSSNEMQTPYFQDREFNKVLYFNPGCYEE